MSSPTTPTPPPTPPAAETASGNGGFFTPVSDWWTTNVRQRFGDVTEDLANNIATSPFGVQQKINPNTIKSLLPVAVGGGVAMVGLLLLEPIQKVSKFATGGLKWALTGGGTARKKGWFEKIPVLGGAFTALGSALDFVAEGVGYAIPAVAGFIGYQMMYTPPFDSGNNRRPIAAVTNLHGISAHGAPAQTEPVTPPSPRPVVGRPVPAPASTVNLFTVPTPLSTQDATIITEAAQANGGALPAPSALLSRIEELLQKDEVATAELTRLRNLMHARVEQYESFRNWVIAGNAYNANEHNLNDPYYSTRNQETGRFRDPVGLGGRESFIHDLSRLGLSEGQARSMVPIAPVTPGQQNSSPSNGVEISPRLNAFAHDFIAAYGSQLREHTSGAAGLNRVTTFEIGGDRTVPMTSAAYTALSPSEKLEFIKKALHFTKERYNRYYEISVKHEDLTFFEASFLRDFDRGQVQSTLGERASNGITWMPTTHTRMIRLKSGFTGAFGATPQAECRLFNTHLLRMEDPDASLAVLRPHYQPGFFRYERESYLNNNDNVVLIANGLGGGGDARTTFGLDEELATLETNITNHLVRTEASQASGVVNQWMTARTQMCNRMRRFGETNMAVFGYYNPGNATCHVEIQDQQWHFVQVADRRNATDPRDYTLCYEFKDGNYVLHSFREGTYTNNAEYQPFSRLPEHRITNSPPLDRDAFNNLINGQGITGAMEQVDHAIAHNVRPIQQKLTHADFNIRSQRYLSGAYTDANHPDEVVIVVGSQDAANGPLTITNTVRVRRTTYDQHASNLANLSRNIVSRRLGAVPAGTSVNANFLATLNSDGVMTREHQTALSSLVRANPRPDPTDENEPRSAVTSLPIQNGQESRLANIADGQLTSGGQSYHYYALTNSSTPNEVLVVATRGTGAQATYTNLIRIDRTAWDSIPEANRANAIKGMIERNNGALSSDASGRVVEESIFSSQSLGHPNGQIRLSSLIYGSAASAGLMGQRTNTSEALITTITAATPAPDPLAEPLAVVAVAEKKPLVIGFMDSGNLPSSQSTPAVAQNNQRLDLSQIRPLGTA